MFHVEFYMVVQYYFLFICMDFLLFIIFNTVKLGYDEQLGTDHFCSL
jgi:hypothetical protein